MSPLDDYGALVESLIASRDPAVRFKVVAGVLGKGPRSRDVARARKEVASSKRVKLLLSSTRENGRKLSHPYRKWTGAHWVLADLADIGYPPGDKRLVPLREAVCDWLLSPGHERSVKTVKGRARRCASQEGNALFYLLKLGLADARTDELARRLILWQWPDGGWNCDKNPDASNSSFHESFLPLRALALYAKMRRSRKAKTAARRAAEIFLKRRMFRRMRDGRVMSPEFTELHYPCYWHYDILAGLKAVAEAGMIGDRRCGEALDLLEAKRLNGGGFPAEKKYYRVGVGGRSGASAVDWGGASKRRMNEFATADALFVLKAAGRL
jgi:hypothetical protein